MGADTDPGDRPTITVQSKDGHLYITSDVSVDSYALFDLTGRRVDWRDAVGSRVFTLSSDHYRTGVYLLRLSRRDGTFSCKVHITN
jgi:hypothetical protein